MSPMGDTHESIDWTRRALAVLTSGAADGVEYADMFAEMAAPSAGGDPLDAMTRYAVGANNLASVLLGMVALERGITRAEACELVSTMIAAIEDDIT